MNTKKYKIITIIAVVLFFAILITRTIIVSIREPDYTEREITEEDLKIPLDELEDNFIDDDEPLRLVRVIWLAEDHWEQVEIDFVQQKKMIYKGSNTENPVEIVDFPITENFKLFMKQYLNDRSTFIANLGYSNEYLGSVTVYGTEHYYRSNCYGYFYPDLWDELWEYINQEKS